MNSRRSKFRSQSRTAYPRNSNPGRLHLLWRAVLLSLVPVVAFLGALLALDTYRLLTFRRIAVAIGAGCAAALAALPINSLLYARLGEVHGHWTGPILEELLKAVFPLWCVRAHRAGFPVDAGILGFATGAGFSLLENLLYIDALPQGTPILWLVRGLGTAVMHGTTTAIVAILAVTAHGGSGGATLAAARGLGVAALVHIFYNSGILSPVNTTIAILIGAPALLAAVFWKSEQMLGRWLAAKLDQDIEVMSMIDSGRFAESQAGRYLQSLSKSFPSEIVGDMLCLIRLSVELSAQAKGDLLRRELGFEPEPDPALPSKLKEMAYLERSLGRAGRLAIAPLAPMRVRDLWEIYRLAQN